ncbi:MAG: hypothetical protein QM762_09250 [Chryseolinea sp.]
MMSSPSHKVNPIVIFTLVFAVVVIGAAWFVYPHSLVFVGIFWSAVALLFAVSFWFRVKPRKIDPAVKQNIAALQDKGVALHHEHEAVLDERDIAVLSKTMRQTILVIPVCTIIGFIVVYFFIEGGPLAYAVLLIFLLLIAASVLMAIKSYRRIIEKGIKIVVRGVVTERWKMKSGSGEDEQVSHYVKIGDRQLQVIESFYNEYLTGDAVEVHFAEIIGKMPHIIHASRIKITNE